MAESEKRNTASMLHGEPPISSAISCPCPCDLLEGLHMGCGRAYRTQTSGRQARTSRRNETILVHRCLSASPKPGFEPERVDVTT